LIPKLPKTLQNTAFSVETHFDAKMAHAEAG
jgi:hypothetical protein